MSISTDGKETVVVLDINTRKSTDKVKVTKSEDNEMVTYKITPKNKVKIESLTDGDGIIHIPKKDEPFKFIELKCSKSNDESLLLTFKYSNGFCRGTVGHNYYRTVSGWNIASDGLYNYIVDKLKNGHKINKNNILEDYNSHLQTISKN